MAATLWFVFMAIAACVLLFVASLATSIAAGDAFGSTLYNLYPSVRSAHQYLTIASVIGWVTLVVLIIILVIAAINTKWSTVSDALLSKDTLSKNELITLYQEQKKLSAGQTARIIVLVALIILAIITFIMGILAVLAAIDLGSVPNPDSKISSAYTWSIVASVAGVGGIGAMIVAVIAYVATKTSEDTEENAIKMAVDRGEKNLNLTEQQLITTTTAPTIQVVSKQ